jgi:CheY-like chemotaxis protein
MLLRPAWSIHTWFMRFPIDVVFLDPEQVVIKIERDVSPFKTATCRGAREVIELASGECARRGLELGDRVAWAARSHRPASESGETALDAVASSVEADSAVLVVSGDPRFTKLIRFLLEGRNVAVVVVSSNQAADAAGSQAFSAIVIDGGTDVPDALRLANAVRVESTAPVLIAREAGDGPVPGSLPIFDKWDETEQLVSEIERLATSGRPSNGA